MTPTQPLTFRLPAPLYERLRKASYEQRESQNAIVVRALERELGTGEDGPVTCGN